MAGQGEDRAPARRSWWTRLLRWRGGAKTASKVGDEDAGAPQRRQRADGHIPRVVLQRSRGTEREYVPGVTGRRYVGTPDIDAVDPFLMVEHLWAEKGGAVLPTFGELPMKGLEAVTYVNAGRVRHWDNQGYEGTIPQGGVQWLAAGAGLVGGESPELQEGAFAAFRIWLNVPQADRGMHAHYLEFGSQRVPVERRDGLKLRVLLGASSQGSEGAVRGRGVEPLLVDCAFEPRAVLDEPVPDDQAVLVLVYSGEMVIAPGTEAASPVQAGEMVVLGQGTVVAAQAGEEGARAILAAARPIGEPVVRSGPIAMANRADLLAALRQIRAEGA